MALLLTVSVSGRPLVRSQDALLLMLPSPGILFTVTLKVRLPLAPAAMLPTFQVTVPPGEAPPDEAVPPPVIEPATTVVVPGTLSVITTPVAGAAPRVGIDQGILDNRPTATCPVGEFSFWKASTGALMVVFAVAVVPTVVPVGVVL